MTIKKNGLERKLVGDVLSKLGIDGVSLSTDLEGLKAVYGAWCRKIPFDNIQKLIHLESGNQAPLPGDDPTDFFEGWLRFGTGGTCWGGSNALYSLLLSLGFKASRATGTMLIAPGAPPNHGSVIVNCDGERFLADTSILHGAPIKIGDKLPTKIAHPAWGINGYPEKDNWYVRWRPFHMLNGCTCRMDDTNASHTTFKALNEETRKWGPFNYSLYFRINRGDTVTGVAFGDRFSFDSRGNIKRTHMSTEAHHLFLSQEMGICKEILDKLPADKPTPPSPASK
ncbi:arylamine N-acetyltransferase [Desulfocicer niacini]